MKKNPFANLNIFASRKSQLLVFLLTWIFFFIACSRMLYRDGFNTKFQGAGVFSSSEEVSKLWVGGPDYGWYFGAAVSWWGDGVLTNPDWHWVTNLWPPGMVGLNTIALELSNGKFPLFVLGLFTCFIWSLVFTWGIFKCKSRLSKTVYLASLGVFLISPPFNYWFLGQNFALPTGFAVGLTLVALNASEIFEKRASNKGYVAGGLLVGLLLGLAAFFRVSNLWAIYFLIPILLLSIIYHMYRLRQSPKENQNRKNTLLSGKQVKVFSMNMVAIISVSLLLVQVWTTVVTNQAHPSNRSFTTTIPELAFGQNWRTDADLSKSAAWTLEYSTNWACRINPKRCLEIATAEASADRPYSGLGPTSTKDMVQDGIFSAISRPDLYVAERLPVAWRSWSGGNNYWGLFTLIITVLAHVLAFFLVLFLRRTDAIIFLAFTLSATLPLFWILLYPYYFLPLQVGSFYFLFTNQQMMYTKAKHFLEVRKIRLPFFWHGTM